MATMKGYTDIEQSKVLAKILPLESADMVYIKHSSSNNPTWEFNEDFPPMILGKVAINKMTVETLPCWSLSALYTMLPEQTDISKSYSDEDAIIYWCWNYPIDIETEEYDNPVDACVEMIIKLHELNLL